MSNMTARRTALVFAIVATAAYWLMWHFGPPSADGSGTMPTVVLPNFQPPLVSNQQYDNNWRIRFLYKLPYITYAGMFGCMAALVSRRRPASTAALLAISTAAMLVGPILVDLLSAIGLWSAPRWFVGVLEGDFLAVTTLLVPLSGLTALVTWLLAPKPSR
jgi:hypothetical protein